MNPAFPASPTGGQPVCQADASVQRFEKVHLDKTVTVGMSAYGNASIALIALRALFNAAHGDFELLLVDDCSPDQGQVRDLFLQTRAEHPNTRVFSFKKNLEYSGSLNCILSHATGKHVLFLSNDIFVTPGYLREMLAVQQGDPRHGIVRGCSNFVDTNLPLHTVAAPNISNSEDLFQVGHDIEQRHRGETVYDPLLTGDAFMVSRGVIDKIGTFDPLFYGYFADHDYGIRAQCAGFKLVLARGAFAYHLQGGNINTLPPAEAEAKTKLRWNRVMENWARFKMKYRMPVEQPLHGETLDQLPWDTLNSQPFGPEHYVAPADYSHSLVPLR